MKQFYEKQFEKLEAKKIAKYGQKKYLEKYIPRYTKYVSLMKWLLPLVAFISLINAVLGLINYNSNHDSYYLTIALIWGLATILWIINIVIHYTHRFKFILQKVSQYQEELKKITYNQVE